MEPGEAGIFHIVLIQPSHYDDDGYVIQWLRSAIPSNPLACLNGIAEDCRERQVLGPDVDIRIEIFDETNQRIRPDRIMRAIEQTGGHALIALVGVQTNQYPRALDIARAFRARAAGPSGGQRLLVQGNWTGVLVDTDLELFDADGRRAAR